eukprot:CAMPEP_0202956694 /NCGR_PEP_ID=MMETSP1396-20130829/1197_1 /ASSEMBLY_ACC=CAM_ASM_000872 /TAXON_ID= /ORGANISM="Pseudokeronopsis sp., Strain Brazil" /LENGTH=41 /DNA_ID= /DNA_START= /DNA_END= /DNA_ORIENTATION=
MTTMGEKMQEHEIEEIVGDADLINGRLISIQDFAKMIMNRV